MNHSNPTHRPLIAAGVLLGIGMGGFVDGILFHQILQLHNMLSNRVLVDTLVNAEINMFWDGLFHAFTWIMTLIGIVLLWRATHRSNVPQSSQTLVGSMFLGWGLFNIIEGIIDHEILQVHHVVQRATGVEQRLWDWVFLFSGIVFALIGRKLIEAGRRQKGVTTPPTVQSAA